MNLSNGVNPADDTVHDPIDVPNWSESFAIWAWDNDNDIGFYSHYQRHMYDKMLWRGFCTVLIGDQVFAHHSFGRELPGKVGPGYEGCRIAIEQPHQRWRLLVDGAGVQRSGDELRKAPITDGPATPIRVDAVLEMRTPVWSLGKAAAATSAEIMPAHYEQKGWCVGTMTVGDRTYELNCFGGNDHSMGPRNFEKLQTGGFVNGIFENNRSLTAIAMSSTEHVGYLNLGDGKLLPVTKVVLPDIAWEPGAKGVMTVEAGDVVADVTVEVTNRRGFFTLLPPNFEHIGFEDGEQTDRVYGDFGCKLEWDGIKGAGAWEPCRVLR